MNEADHKILVGALKDSHRTLLLAVVGLLFISLLIFLIFETELDSVKSDNLNLQNKLNSVERTVNDLQRDKFNFQRKGNDNGTGSKK